MRRASPRRSGGTQKEKAAQGGLLYLQCGHRRASAYGTTTVAQAVPGIENWYFMPLIWTM